MRRAWIAAALVSVSGLLSAQSPFTAADVPVSQEATKQAHKFRSLVYGKKTVRRNVRKLTKELVWHKTLEDATTAAEISGKPIILIQALGDLKGYV